MNKIAIVIPCYNCEKFIEESVSSALSQTYKNTEVIAIDDLSSDNTLDILNKIKSDKLHVIQNSINKGASESRNIGIEKATQIGAKYVQFLDGDDIIDKDAVKEKETILREDRISMVYSEYWNMTEDGETLSYEHKPTFNYERLMEDNYITCLSMHKIENLIEINGFDRYLTYCEDWDLALRIARLGMPVLYPKAHFSYRINPKSQTREIDWHLYGLDKRIVMVKQALSQRQCSTKDLIKAYNDKILYMRAKNE